MNLGKQVNQDKWGYQIFLDQDLFWWLQRNLVACLFWAAGKTYNAKILQGASLTQHRTSEFYSGLIGQSVELKFQIFQETIRLPVLPFYPEYNSVSNIRIRLQKAIKCLGLSNIKLKIRIVLTELFSR